MKRAALLLVVILTVIAVDASIRGVDESREFTVVVTDPENSLISYECNMKAKLMPGHWTAVRVAELKNRMPEEVEISYSQHFWVEGGDGIRLIGVNLPFVLQPFESREVRGGFIIDEHATSGKLYFVFSAVWPNGSAVIKTGVCPLEVDVKEDAMSAWALPEDPERVHRWDDGDGGYFYYGGGDVRIPLYGLQDFQVGWLEITGSGDTTIICYNLSTGYRIEKVNLMVKNQEISESNPENYHYTSENVSGESFCIDVGGFREGYVAAHAVVTW